MRKRLVRMGWALCTSVVVADSALTACGGDGSTDQGCGGDLEGRWVITTISADAMGDSMTSVKACDSVAADALANATFEPNGATITFSGGTYTEAGTIQKKLHYKYTNDCLTAQQGDPASDATCAMVESNLAAAGFPATCHFAASTCVCDVTQDIAVDGSGTYRVDGTKLVFDDQKSGSPFCVRGEEGHVNAPPSSPVSGSIAISRNGR